MARTLQRRRVAAVQVACKLHTNPTAASAGEIGANYVVAEAKDPGSASAGLTGAERILKNQDPELVADVDDEDDLEDDRPVAAPEPNRYLVAEATS